MSLSTRLAAALIHAGARLKRQRKHRIYALPNGNTVVMSSTPSDRRAEQNALSVLREAVGAPVEPVRKKASATVRAERRARPGRHGEKPWSSGVAVSAALQESGLMEAHLNGQLLLLQKELGTLKDEVETLKKTLFLEKLLHDALREWWIVRAWSTCRGWFGLPRL